MSTKESAIPSLFASVPFASITSVIPSLSLSRSTKFGKPSLSKSASKSFEPFASVSNNREVDVFNKQFGEGEHGEEPVGPSVSLLSYKFAKPSPSKSAAESTCPSPFVSTPPASIKSGIPSLSLSRSRCTGLPSPSAS